MLYAAALKIMANIAGALGEKQDQIRFAETAMRVSEKIDEFWDETKGCYVYGKLNGSKNPVYTKHPNIFAVLLGFASDEKKEAIRKFLIDPNTPEITTPYMKFYELSALCELGEYTRVTEIIKEYWGGMLNEGATSFWEKYDKRESGSAKYAMYGRRYGKSLCHAWGAAPLYIIGKYFIGLTPDTDGYGSYVLQPHLTDIGDCSATFPLNEGYISISVDKNKLTVYSDRNGKLIFKKSMIADRPFERHEDKNVIYLKKGLKHTICFNQIK